MTASAKPSTDMDFIDSQFRRTCNQFGRGPAFSNAPTCHVGEGALTKPLLGKLFFENSRPGILPEATHDEAKPSPTPSTTLLTSKSSRPRPTYISVSENCKCTQTPLQLWTHPTKVFVGL